MRAPAFPEESSIALKNLWDKPDRAAIYGAVRQLRLALKEFAFRPVRELRINNQSALIRLHKKTSNVTCAGLFLDFTDARTGRRAVTVGMPVQLCHISVTIVQYCPLSFPSAYPLLYVSPGSRLIQVTELRQPALKKYAIDRIAGIFARPCLTLFVRLELFEARTSFVDNKRLFI